MFDGDSFSLIGMQNLNTYNTQNDNISYNNKFGTNNLNIQQANGGNYFQNLGNVVYDNQDGENIVNIKGGVWEGGSGAINIY